jgi:hypothetical protein
MVNFEKYKFVQIAEGWGIELSNLSAVKGKQDLNLRGGDRV